MVVLLRPAAFPCNVLVCLLLCKELLLRTDWTPEHLVRVREHVIPQTVLECEPVRALFAEMAVLQQVHVVCAHVLLNLHHPLEVLTAPVASYGA